MVAPLQHSCLNNKVLLLLFFLFFFTSTLISAHNHFPQRKLLSQFQDEDQPPIIKKKSTPTIPTKNQTKLTKPTSKNQTTPIKSPSNSSKNKTISLTHLKKLNSTSNSLLNAASDLTKSPSLKNKTTKSTTKKETKLQLEKDSSKPKSNPAQSSKPNKAQNKQQQANRIAAAAAADDGDDLISDFRDLPYKFHESIVPDLEQITKSSKIYITKYNKEFTKGFKPYVGNKYAPAFASFVSFAFIVIPLILVSFIFNRIKAYFSLQKLLIFIQIYLAIYFTILCLSSVATSLEPLRFFYATSKSTYICVQVMQTLAYVLYLLLLLMYLVLVFSTETGLATKLLGLCQTFVGFSVGLHYYTTVFHRAVLRQPPKTSWKAHALYATCFFAICLLGRVDRRKKAYLEDGGEEGKQN